ncbi:MAG: SOS response-associated peptidase [Anaerolineaceae bacterium]|nr:SOS response-associated peptidase [Anaerolineaceae bacterium]
MCGRFVLVALADEIADMFELQSVPEPFAQRFNVAPSQEIAVITNERPEVLAWHRWGLVPFWAKEAKIGYRMINARSETAAEKPSFRAAFRSRRCLIPASGFFEWRRRGKEKQPLFISLRERPLFAFAGLWEVWRNPEGEALYSATILTTVANRFMADIHLRMPVILQPDDYDTWLNPASCDEHQGLLRPCAAEPMQAWPVSTVVNRPANDTPETIEPLL